MTVLALAGLAMILIAGGVHVFIFTLESVAWRTRGARTFRIPATDVETVRPWAFNQGWYNLLLAIGAIAGSVTTAIGMLAPERLPDRLLGAAFGVTIFCAATMLIASLVLLATSREQLRGVLVQGLAPVLGLVALLIATV